MKVTDMKILGKGKNLYLLNWYHYANHGCMLIQADTEKEAREVCMYGDSVTFLVTKIDPENMPVVFEGESMRGEL